MRKENEQATTTTTGSSDKARTQRQMKDRTEVKYVVIKNDPERKIHLLSMKMCVCVRCVYAVRALYFNTIHKFMRSSRGGKMEMEVHATRLLILVVRATKFLLLFIRPYRRFIYAG